MNYSTATPAELAAAGMTIARLPSQAKRRRKSLFGVRPSINRANHNSAKPMKAADEIGTGKISG